MSSGPSPQRENHPETDDTNGGNHHEYMMIAAQNPFPPLFAARNPQQPRPLLAMEEISVLVARARMHNQTLFRNFRPTLADVLEREVFQDIFRVLQFFSLNPRTVLDMSLVREYHIILQWNENGLRMVPEDSPERIIPVADEDANYPLRSAAQYAGITTPYGNGPFRDLAPGTVIVNRQVPPVNGTGNAAGNDNAADNDFQNDQEDHSGIVDHPMLDNLEAEELDIINNFEQDDSGSDADGDYELDDDYEFPEEQVVDEPQQEDDGDGAQQKGGDDEPKPETAFAAQKKRKKGTPHHFIRDAPTINLPMPKAQNGMRVNFTMVELMTFLPQTHRAPTMINRIFWNKGSKASLANMIKAHRLNDVQDMPNSLLRSMQSEMAAFLEIDRTKWKFKDHDKWVPKDDQHDPESIDMATYKIPLKDNPTKDRKAKCESAVGVNPILFSRLAYHVRHLPTGHDALDLTRCVQYVLDHPDQCRDFRFPTDYFKVLQLVGGPNPVTPAHKDETCFIRWWGRHINQLVRGEDPKWEKECEEFLDKYAAQVDALVETQPTQASRAPKVPQAPKAPKAPVNARAPAGRRTFSVYRDPVQQQPLESQRNQVAPQQSEGQSSTHVVNNFFFQPKGIIAPNLRGNIHQPTASSLHGDVHSVAPVYHGINPEVSSATNFPQYSSPSQAFNAAVYGNPFGAMGNMNRNPLLEPGNPRRFPAGPLADATLVQNGNSHGTVQHQGNTKHKGKGKRKATENLPSQENRSGR